MIKTRRSIRSQRTGFILNKIATYLPMLLIVLSLSAPAINAQAGDYFPFNSSMRSVYFNYRYSSWGPNVSSYGYHSEMGIIKDTMAGGKKYYALSNRFLSGDALDVAPFYRMGEDNKLYFLSPQGEKLMLDFSDTSQYTFLAYFPDKQDPVSVTREQTIRGVELKFSFQYLNEIRWFKFRKGLGLVSRRYWLDIGLGYNIFELEIAEFFMIGAAGDTIKYTSNKKPEFKSQSYQWVSYGSIKAGTIVKHLYYPYRNLAGVTLPYIENVSIDYRYAKPNDSTAIQTVTVQNLNDTLSFLLQLDTVKLWQGYSFLYRFKATTRGIYPTSAVYPVNGNYFVAVYTNPDTGYTFIKPLTSIRYSKLIVRPGIDTVPAGEEELQVFGDTIISGKSYRRYQFGGRTYFVKVVPASRVLEYYENSGGTLTFAGKDSLPAFVSKTGQFFMIPMDSLSFINESTDNTYGVAGKTRRYERSDAGEYLMVHQKLGPVQVSKLADPTVPGEYLLYKANRIVYDGALVYTNIEVENPPPSVRPTGIRIDQNYPNPVVSGSGGSGSGYTTIRFYSDHDAMASIQIFNANGELLFRETKQTRAFEENAFVLKNLNLPSGVYIYRLTVGSKIETKKMLIVR